MAMRTILLGAAALTGLASLTACATYEPCTRNWFEARADQMQRDFERRNRGEVRRLRTLQSQLEDGMGDGVDVFAVLALASAKKDVGALVADFREYVVPEARAAAATCELDQGYDIITTAFLTQMGVDTRVMAAMDLLGAYEGTPGIMQAIQPGPTVPPGRSSVPGVTGPEEAEPSGGLVRGRPGS